MQIQTIIARVDRRSNYTAINVALETTDGTKHSIGRVVDDDDMAIMFDLIWKQTGELLKEAIERYSPAPRDS